MSREAKRVIFRIENYLNKQQDIITNMLLSETEDVIKRTYFYDKENRTFDVDPSDMVYFNQTIEEYHEKWITEVKKILKEFYQNKNLDVKKFKEYLKDKEPAIKNHWNFVMCSLILEGHYGIDREEVRKLLSPYFGKIKSVQDATIEIILNLNKENHEKTINAHNELVIANRNWLQSISFWLNQKRSTIKRKLKVLRSKFVFMRNIH